MADRLATVSSIGRGVRRLPSPRSNPSGARENSSIRCRRFGEAVQFAALPLLLSLVTAGLDEGPEGLGEGGVEHLDQQHHVEVLGRAEGQAGVAHQKVASHAADQNIAVGVGLEVGTPGVEAGHHGMLSRSCSAACATRSSAWSRTLR
jgi:hypothetical protein